MSNNPERFRHARELLLRGDNQRALTLLRENGQALDSEAIGILTDLDATTITRYAGRSDDAGRYADDPFPAPMIATNASPVWAVDRVPEILAWRARHGRRDAGGRRPWPERAGTPANAAAKPSRGKRSSQ